MFKDSVAVHHVPHSATVFHCSVPKSLCTQIVSAFQDLEKFDMSTHVNNNLIKTLRTDWHCHNEPLMASVVQGLITELATCFQSIDCPDDMQIKISFLDSWIAESQEGAEIEPHKHTEVSNIWSFCLYARVPEEGTSLSFCNSRMEKKRVPVREGDLLVFPSNLAHYSFDTHFGRMVYAGNISVVWEILES